MTREEIIKVRIGDVLYNRNTKAIVKMSSQWSENKIDVNDADCLSANGLDGYGYAVVMMGDFESWEYYDAQAPDDIRLRVAEIRLNELERFVYQRLR